MAFNRSLFDDPAAEGGGAGAAPENDPQGPLPERMRPRALDEIIGQEAVIGEGAFLRRAVLEDRVPSLIFWGPPGSGKTTMARLMATETSSHFVPFSAVTSGIKEVKAVMADAERLRRAQGRRTLLFVDEIHRFNRAQQDAFLPYVESGDITLVGATTENPSFSLNAALISRCRVVVLEPLGIEELAQLLARALEDPVRGLGSSEVEADRKTLSLVAQLASGDARKALNLLESAVTDAVSGRLSQLDAEQVQRVAQRKVLLYDKSGEEHFNLISALHKSLRESDADASVYWLTRMLEAGEDPLYLARRLVRFASEDVGLADPQALPQAVAAWEAFRRLGLPEGALALVQCTVYLALAPKSNAVYMAYKKAKKVLSDRPADPVPKVIRNAPTRLMGNLGYGSGYVYAHDTETGVGGLDCLPEALQGERFYVPKEIGHESELRQRIETYLELRAQARETKG